MTLSDVTPSDTTPGDLTLGDDLQWHRVCEVTDLEPAWGEVALVGDRQLALFSLGENEIYAVDHRDPLTRAHVMARGIVGSKGDRPTIASPLHKQVYDLETGACYGDDSLRLAVFRTRVVAGSLEVEVPA